MSARFGPSSFARIQTLAIKLSSILLIHITISEPCGPASSTPRNAFRRRQGFARVCRTEADINISLKVLVLDLAAAG